MSNDLAFFSSLGVLFVLGMALYAKGMLDERRWKREREMEEALRRAAE